MCPHVLNLLAKVRRALCYIIRVLHQHLFRQQYLAQLAADTGGSVYVAADLERLREAFEQVVDEFRSRYLLTYTPQGVEAGGWHELEVRVRGRGRRVQARPGYLR